MDGALVDVVEYNVVVVDIGALVCVVVFNSLGFVAVDESVSVLCVVLFAVGVVVVVANFLIFFCGSFVVRLIVFTFSCKTFSMFSICRVMVVRPFGRASLITTPFLDSWLASLSMIEISEQILHSDLFFSSSLTTRRRTQCSQERSSGSWKLMSVLLTGCRPSSRRPWRPPPPPLSSPSPPPTWPPPPLSSAPPPPPG